MWSCVQKLSPEVVELLGPVGPDYVNEAQRAAPDGDRALKVAALVKARGPGDNKRYQRAAAARGKGHGDGTQRGDAVGRGER